VAAAQEAVSSQGIFRVALSGGNTPRPLYEALAGPPYRDEIDWTRIQVFFSDERFVPPDSPESNYHMAFEALLSKVPIPERYVHRVATVDISPQESAALYEEGLRRVFEVGLAEVPRFDLILLGLGPDGHTASLFPDTEALRETEHLVAANFVPKFDSWRITFTYPLLDAAHQVMFLVQGEDKAERVREVFAGEGNLPAAGVQVRDGATVWLLDRAAAAKLPQELRTSSAGEAT
jgi:6-phosphogluconolactonase